MASNQRPMSAMGGGFGAVDAGGREKSYFELQREALIGEIAMNFEHVLANINKLNRNLEAVIAVCASFCRDGLSFITVTTTSVNRTRQMPPVGNEFSSVEALWSQFENVMAKDSEEEGNKTEAGDEGDEEKTPKKEE
ncbi:hypothetical protein TruAng_004959 [Truncatella angustata]|nr:hypothetical protein TruAng_004959 [Truncatella angustata]